jgi:hypothetical protein
MAGRFPSDRRRIVALFLADLFKGVELLLLVVCEMSQMPGRILHRLDSL